MIQDPQTTESSTSLTDAVDSEFLNQGPIIATIACALPQPVPKVCCCCVTSVAIQNVKYVGSQGETRNLPPSRYGKKNLSVSLFNGHFFDLVIQMYFEPGSAGVLDCTLVWKEWTTHPAAGINVAAKTWNDLYKLNASDLTFAPWKNKKIPCPQGGALTVRILDAAGLGNALQPNYTRVLRFELGVSSAAGCPCAQSGATVTATQILKWKNNLIDYQSFKIDP